MDREYKKYKKKIKQEQKKRVKEMTEKAMNDGYLSYTDFTFLIQDFLVSPTGYVADRCTNSQVCAIIAVELVNKIKKHPILWKILFMVA